MQESNDFLIALTDFRFKSIFVVLNKEKKSRVLKIYLFYNKKNDY